MTVSDLIAKLSAFPADVRVVLLDQDKGWLLPIEIVHLSSDSSTCGVALLTITDRASDEIEGLTSHRALRS